MVNIELSMNKRLLLILSMLLMVNIAKGQFVKATFGLTGGGIASQMITDIPLAKPAYISGYGGLFTTLNFGGMLGVRAGANYSMQGADFIYDDATITVSQHYLNVPVALMVNLRSFVSLELGFFQNILLMSSLKEERFSDFILSPDEGALKYNFGALAGVSFNVGRFVFFNVRYNYGLSKSYASMGKGFPVNTLTAGVGFNIVSTRKTIF